MKNNKIIDEKKVKMIYKKIVKENSININNKEKIDSFDKKFKKAINTVKGSRVKRYKFYPSNRVVWIVEGQKSEYQIFPLANFCSCNDFYFHVVNNDIRFCYHLLAQKIAEFVNYYENLDVTDNRYEILMEVWRNPVEKRILPINVVEKIRIIVIDILTNLKDLPASQIADEVMRIGIFTLNPKHIAIVLASDKKKRFICKNGLWSLRKF